MAIEPGIVSPAKDIIPMTITGNQHKKLVTTITAI